MASVRYVARALRNGSDVDGLLRAVSSARGRGGGVDIQLRPGPIYPSGAVPFAAALALFRGLGYPVRIGLESDEARAARIAAPLQVTAARMKGQVFSKVWQYHNEREAMLLCKAFVEALSEHAECGEGVIESLSWCLYEVMDNVFQHSKAGVGFAMMQVHLKSRMCAVSVADAGIGVHRSFVEGGVHPAQDAYEALKLALQERVTSKSKNMGNGLFGLIRVVGLNGGSLRIRSGRGEIEYTDAHLAGNASFSRPVMELNDHHGTFVNWELDLSRPVRIQDALTMPNRTNLRLEELENADGEHEVRVAEFEEGLGSRRSAEQVRLKLVNLLNEGVPRLVLNFEDVSIVSSSFADEVLGKLALGMGLLEFMRRFELRSMTPTVEAIVERAIQQRIQEGDDSTPGSGGTWRPTR